MPGKRPRSGRLILGVCVAVLLAVAALPVTIDSANPTPAPTVPRPPSRPAHALRQAPVLPAPPKAAPLPAGAPDQQAAQLADLLASDKTRLAGWLAVYEALGVPVIGPNGKPLGRTGADPIGPRYWQVWYAAGLDRPGRGIPLSDAGRLIAAGLPGPADTTLGAALLADLQLAAQSKDAQVRLLASFVRERVRRGPSRADLLAAGATPDKLPIDLATVQLLGWVALRGVLLQPAGHAAAPAHTLFVDFPLAPPQRPPGQLGPHISCAEQFGANDATYWTNWIINKIGGGVQLPGMSKGLPGVIERLQTRLGAFESTIARTSAALSWVNAFTSAASLAMQLAAMEVTAQMDPEPLERTKDTSNGQTSLIHWRLSAEPGNIPDGDELESCFMTFVTNALGVAFSFPSGGRIPGAELEFEGGQGFPNLVLFANAQDLLGKETNEFGEATITIIGRAQRRRIPDSAQPVDKEFSIIVSGQPEAVTGNTIANIFFNGLTFGAAASVPAGISALVDILKTVHWPLGEHVFRLIDWQAPGYKATGGDGALTYTGVVCSLEKPFTITGNGELTLPIHFAPSGPQAGSASYDTNAFAVQWTGGGPYSVDASNPDRVRIVAAMQSGLATAAAGSYAKAWTAHIDLVPLDTDECSRP